MSSPLLSPHAAASDQHWPDSAKALRISVETLVPMRNTVMEATPDLGIATLQSRFVDTLKQERHFEPHSVRLVHGCSFLDESKSLRAAGIAYDSRVIAVAHRSSHHTVWHSVCAWWPLLLTCGVTLVLVLVTISSASTAANVGSRPSLSTTTCGAHLAALVCVGAPMLVPYALVASGLTQAERGHRMLWFWQYRPLVWLVMLNGLLGCVWLIVGGSWLSSDDAPSAKGSCSAAGLDALAPAVAAAQFVWWALLLETLPWVLLIVAPCLALGRFEVGFALIAFMAGIHRHPDGTSTTYSKGLYCDEVEDPRGRAGENEELGGRLVENEMI